MATYDWGSILGGLFNTGGLAASAYLPYANAGETMTDIQTATEAFSTGASNLGTTATAGLNFTPFSVTSGAGTGSFDSTGSLSMSMSPEQQAIFNNLMTDQQGAAIYNPNQFLSGFGDLATSGAYSGMLNLQQTNPYLQQMGTNYLSQASTMPQQIDTSYAQLLGQNALTDANNFLYRGSMSDQLQQQIANTYGMQALQGFQPTDATAAMQTGQQFMGAGSGMLQQGLMGNQQLGQLGGDYLAQVQQAAQQGIDPSQFQALQNQALFQAQQGLETGGPTQSELFQQMQDARSGAQERDRLALENRLAAQGRLGVQTAAFGGTPEALAMEKAFQEQASQDFLSSTQMADQLRSSNIAQSQNLFGLGQQAAMTPQQLESQRLSNVGQQFGLGSNALSLQNQLQQSQLGSAANLFGAGAGTLGLQGQLQNQALANTATAQNIGTTASQTDLARQMQQLQAGQSLYGMGTGSYQLPLSLQQQQLGIQSGMFGLGSQAEQLQRSLYGADIGNLGSLSNLGMNAYMGEQGLVGGNLQNMLQRYQTAYMPEQQLLTAMNPSLSLQNILSGYNTAEANALTQLGMAGLEAEMGGLSSMSQLEAARVNALADSLQGLFGATAGAESPIDSLIQTLLGGSGG